MSHMKIERIHANSSHVCDKYESVKNKVQHSVFCVKGNNLHNVLLVVISVHREKRGTGWKSYKPPACKLLCLSS